MCGGGSPRLYKWVLNVIMRVFMRERQRKVPQTQREADVTVEAGLGEMWPHVKETSSHWKLEEARQPSPLESSEGLWPY